MPRVARVLMRLPSRDVSRRAALLVVGSFSLLTACGVRHGEYDRARVFALTCASTIARNGLAAPTPPINPERFVLERRRLLASGRQFNTVSPYKNVCSAIRDELRTSPTVPWPTP